MDQIAEEIDEEKKLNDRREVLKTLYDLTESHGTPSPHITASYIEEVFREEKKLAPKDDLPLSKSVSDLLSSFQRRPDDFISMITIIDAPGKHHGYRVNMDRIDDLRKFLDLETYYCNNNSWPESSSP